MKATATIQRRRPRPTSSSLVELSCLSVRQPFASAFFDQRPGRLKFCENRSWASAYRGPLWIHASSQEKCPQLFSDPSRILWADPTRYPVRMTGHIIGRVTLRHIVDLDTLELLSMISPADFAAGRVPRSVSRYLRPSERDDWLERNRGVYDWLQAQDVTPEQFDMHVCGPRCWLVDEPRLLKEPIPTGGRLQLWKHSVPAKRLEFVE